MDEEFRFVLLDFGHPMKKNTIKSVMDSLENMLSLGLTFTGHPKMTYFGISFLKSDFTILQSESYLLRNYDNLNRNINALLETMKNNEKVTVAEYKYYLSNSIKMILEVSREKLKVHNSGGQSKSARVKVAIVTKKTASILVDILMDVSKKTLENSSTARIDQNYKIVQILNELDEKTRGTSDECDFIKWTTCLDNGSDLNYFFKDWFLNRPEKLQITLSKELNFSLHCDIDNFIVNPILVISDEKYDLYSDVCFKALVMNPLTGILKFVRNLEIINRLPVASLCPTLVFGVPRRLRATRDSSSGWVESQTNLKMFKELCRELHQTGQGLLARSAAKMPEGELITFHFLTSDGDVLLMNSVTPDELYLPKRVKSSKPNSGDDDSASSLIKSCIRKIKFLDEYSPPNFTSGLYQYLKKHLLENGQSKNSSESFDANVKVLEKKYRKTGSLSRKNDSNDENCSGPKKKRKLCSKELRNTHPALLSPEVIEKYRKIPSDVFNLLELGEDFNDTLT